MGEGWILKSFTVLQIKEQSHASSHGAEEHSGEDGELPETRGQGRKESSFPGQLVPRASQSLGTWAHSTPLVLITGSLGSG